MNRLTTALCLTLLVCLIFLGCATPLQEHKPQTPDEAAIKELLMKWNQPGMAMMYEPIWPLG